MTRLPAESIACTDKAKIHTEPKGIS